MAGFGERVVQGAEGLLAAEPLRGDEIEEVGRGGAEDEDDSLVGDGKLPGMDREREAIDGEHQRGASEGARLGGGPYSFSMVHCSGCWFRRA